jgi:hypothetical protein
MLVVLGSAVEARRVISWLAQRRGGGDAGGDGVEAEATQARVQATLHAACAHLAERLEVPTAHERGF